LETSPNPHREIKQNEYVNQREAKASEINLGIK